MPRLAPSVPISTSQTAASAVGEAVAADHPDRRHLVPTPARPEGGDHTITRSLRCLVTASIADHGRWSGRRSRLKAGDSVAKQLGQRRALGQPCANLGNRLTEGRRSQQVA
ncbi:MAG: hypothetical protein M3Z25_21455 [Actinomycetota bacterium]|nr:hypothetical protein [Actinomycetota bacterium]